MTAADNEARSVASVVVILVTDPDLAAEVSAVAQATFPLACPAHASPDDISAHLAANLRPDDFRSYISDPDMDVLAARVGADGPIVGYSLVVHAPPADPAVAAVVTGRPVSEVSKMYVLPDHHAHRGDRAPSHALMSAAIECARTRGSADAWLGVNQDNVRAQRFYAKMGFTRAGVKTFSLNGTIEHDYVMIRSLTGTPR